VEIIHSNSEIAVVIFTAVQPACQVSVSIKVYVYFKLKGSIDVVFLWNEKAKPE
jgi:hypothetical protein